MLFVASTHSKKCKMEELKHECGIALVRLLKPLKFYKEKYGTWMYGLEKLYLLMEKQHNRGQDGAGAVNIKLNQKPGKKYIHRYRSNHAQPIKEIFDKINANFQKAEQNNSRLLNDPQWAKENLPFAGELYLGHLRYGTFGKNNIENVHPVMRQNNWKSRNLVLAGNFNLTNVDELFESLTDLGQHPIDYSDTVTILENVGHFLDEENQGLFDLFKKRDYNNKEISPLIEKNLDLTNILRSSSKRWDGGYAIAGMIGHGDSFVLRDPSGIRPAYYYKDEEVVVVASERAVIQTAMKVAIEKIKEVKPGYALIVKYDGTSDEVMIKEPLERKSCSFERIYFSRGSDADIYRERKKLGFLLKDQILKTIDNDVINSVFSFIPNTAETAFYGMVSGMQDHLKTIKTRKIKQLPQNASDQAIDEIVSMRIRIEKIAIKDAKLRTFISDDLGRDKLVEHVYDITYGTVREQTDNLVIIDDSIVRGTTLKQSIIRILDRLNPKQIVVVSSSPQIRYPDCYGIDMAKLGDFIAFKAAICLLEESGQSHIIDEVYQKSKAQEFQPKEKITNYVKEIYKPFSAEEISEKIARLVSSDEIKSTVKVVYQSIENLHAACPNDLGDWYFTGNYPTPGGNKVVNQAFINYIEKRSERAY